MGQCVRLILFCTIFYSSFYRVYTKRSVCHANDLILRKFFWRYFGQPIAVAHMEFSIVRPLFTSPLPPDYSRLELISVFFTINQISKFIGSHRLQHWIHVQSEITEQWKCKLCNQRLSALKDSDDGNVLALENAYSVYSFSKWSCVLSFNWENNSSYRKLKKNMLSH